MSSNAFMLPALPQIPASGLNGTDTKGPAAFKSGPPGEASDAGKSFSATLNQISERRYGSKPKATPAEKTKVTSRGSNTDSASSQKMSKASDHPHDDLKQVETSRPKESAPFICSLPDDGLMPSQTAPALPLLIDLFGNLNLRWQQVTGKQLSIGAFEQLQTDISPEAINQAFFEQLGFSAIAQKDVEGVAGKTVRFFEFWQQMFPSVPTAPDGAINGQPESSGINGNAALNPLLQMAGLSATDPEALHLNAELLLKLATSSQPAQTEISENAKMAVDSPVSRLSFWATGDVTPQAFLETQTRQMSENSQRLEVQTAIKAAVEQPANPNSASEGLTARPPAEAFDIKSAVEKSEMLLVDRLGDKMSQIDGDSKDSGFLFSQDQMSQHLARLENSATASEASQRSLMPQTLNQIVQRAVLSFHNGQHEVELHLKPEFLGHVRMQIISEGHQVAIKMVAEFPFVKDILESNLHQLRADLQAQGLNIGELDVSVAHDSHAKGDLNQNAGAAKLQILKTDAVSDDGSSVKPGEAESRDGVSMAETAIDYFA